MDFFNPENFEGNIAIIGVGSIGSTVALGLTKMGIRRFHIYDYDYVEQHNRPNQMVFFKSTGIPKVEAVSEVMRAFAPDGENSLIIDTHAKPFFSDTVTECELVIIAVDSREARLGIWEALKNCPKVVHLIDARMGGESLRVYNIRMDNEEHRAFYEESFEGEASELPCTGQAIIYNLWAIFGFVGSSVRKYVAGEDIPKRILHDTRNWMSVLTK